MPVGLLPVQGPAAEPVSLAEAKLWISQDLPDDDPLVATLVRAARGYVQGWADRQLVSAKLQLTLDRFPRYGSSVGLQYQVDDFLERRVPATDLSAGYWPDRGSIRPPRSPLQGVSAIQYQALDGTPTTLDPTLYTIDVASQPGRIVPAYGQIWPIARQGPGSVTVTYVAGYGPVTTVALAIAPGLQTVTPASMFGIYPHTTLVVDSCEFYEQVVVESVTATTFTATFVLNHWAGVAIGPGVPDEARLAMQLLIAHWYQNREAVGQVGGPTALAVESLLYQCWPGELN